MTPDPVNPSPATPAPKTPARKSGRGLRLVLVASLALNLLAVGVFAGGAMRAARMPPPEGQIDVRAVWRALPDGVRASLREAAPGRPDGPPRQSREERRARAAAANERLIGALRQEPFDAEAFRTLLNGDRLEFARRLDRAQAALAEEVADLSPAERAAMAERLEAFLERRER